MKVATLVLNCLSALVCGVLTFTLLMSYAVNRLELSQYGYVDKHDGIAALICWFSVLSPLFVFEKNEGGYISRSRR